MVVVAMIYGFLIQAPGLLYDNEGIYREHH